MRVYLGVYFGIGMGVILMDNVNCIGSERFLVLCLFCGFGYYDCSYGEDVGVVC